MLFLVLRSDPVWKEVELGSQGPGFNLTSPLIRGKDFYLLASIYPQCFQTHIFTDFPKKKKIKLKLCKDGKAWAITWQPTPVFLAGESPWTKEPGRLQSIGLCKLSKELNTTEATEPSRTIKLGPPVPYHGVKLR